MHNGYSDKGIINTLSVNKRNCLKRYIVVTGSESTDSVGKFPISDHDGVVVYAEIEFAGAKQVFIVMGDSKYLPL